MIALAVLGLALPGFAAQRFPQPQFETPYAVPPLTTPMPRTEWRERLDVAVLAIALALAAWIAVRARSRAWLLTLQLACLGYFGLYRKGCVCPVGAIQNVALALGSPEYAIPLVIVAFFLLPLLFALWVGRVFCGAVCPLGAVQDLVVVRPIHVPIWLSRPLELAAPLYLALALWLAATGARFVICEYDPFVGFFRFSGFPETLILGGLFLLFGTVMARPYCRFFCPYGVLLGWFSSVSRWHLSITPTDCVQCRLCVPACPVDAVLPANFEDAREPRESGRRRLTGLLLLLPFLALLGARLGAGMARHMGTVHRAVRLAQHVREEDLTGVAGKTPETLAFHSSDTSVATLTDEAERIRRRLIAGGRWWGACIGLVIGSRLIALSVRRTRLTYEPSRGSCLNCGRCWKACPKEQERRRVRNRAADDGDISATLRAGRADDVPPETDLAAGFRNDSPS